MSSWGNKVRISIFGESHGPAIGAVLESLPAGEGQEVYVSYFRGYLEAENLDRLKKAAKDNAWGLLAEDPTEADNVPTKLKNNRFVSLI